MQKKMSESALWEIVEMEAIEKYYIGNATKPAITINTGITASPDAKRGCWYTVYFGNGIAHYNCKNHKQARLKAEEILSHPTHKISVKVYGKNNKFLHYLSFSPQLMRTKNLERNKQ
jgi:hypothetical protein